MSTKAAEVNPTTLLQQAVPAGHWRFVGDEEMPAAVAALASVIGKAQSKLPSWQRRLAVTVDGKTHLLVVEACNWKDPNSVCGWVDTDTHATTGTPTALPIPAAAALLASDFNPERELLRRRKLAAALEAKETAKREAKRKADEAAKAAKAKDAAERAQYHAPGWSAMPAPMRAMLRLALAVEKRDAELAADIRASVSAALRPDDEKDFPRALWSAGLDVATLAKMRPLSVAEQRDQVTLSEIPPDRLVILKCLHGADPAKIAAHWRKITEQRGA